jgi:capsular exopolysaccharide synthesis family protein
MTGPDPSEITEWVNALVQAYADRNVDEAAASFHKIMDEIRRGMAEFRTSLGQADAQRFRTAADQELYVPENQQEILTKNLETYNNELTQLRVTIGTLEAELDGLSRIRAENGDVTALQRIAQDPVARELNSKKRATERELERVAAEKRPRHPEYLALRTELDQIEEKITAQVRAIEEQLREEHRLARARETKLTQDIRLTEKEAYRVQEATTTYEMSKNDAESKRKVYDVVAETMERHSIGAQLIYMNNNISVLDTAIEPRHPIRPRKSLTVAFSLFAGLLLAVGAVLFLDYLDNTIRTPDEIEQFLGLGVVAIIPKYRDPNAHSAREAFQSLRTGILFSSQAREKRILMFSSAGPQEGKSATVALVSRSLASAGDRVLVIDADLRRPTQHHHMQVPREPGVTNYLLDGIDGKYQPFVQSTGVPNLEVMTCGPIPPNPPELIGSKKFLALLEDLKKTYDWVILDSPPVANLADSIVLGSLSDLMIMVIKQNENDRELIRRCLKRLARWRERCSTPSISRARTTTSTTTETTTVPKTVRAARRSAGGDSIEAHGVMMETRRRSRSDAVAIVALVAFGLAVLSGCQTADERTALLEDRAQYSVALTSWADRGDGTLVASVRITGPVRSELEILTFEIQGRDGQDSIIMSQWATVDLSEMLRGTPIEKTLILDSDGLPLEGLAVDLHSDPAPEVLSKLKELEGMV